MELPFKSFSSHAVYWISQIQYWVSLPGQLEGHHREDLFHCLGTGLFSGYLHALQEMRTLTEDRNGSCMLLSMVLHWDYDHYQWYRKHSFLVKFIEENQENQE